jgi:hypothetical protein
MSLDDRYLKALQKKSKKNTGRFPAATVAFYGPNRDLATKVVVGIISQPDSEPAELKRWWSTAIDIRRNAKVMKEVLDFIRAREVAEVALLDVIFGCPHEEGTDYPEGESCPHCPYWAGRDRLTGIRVQ